MSSMPRARTATDMPRKGRAEIRKLDTADAWLERSPSDFGSWSFVRCVLWAAIRYWF
jgi:hypothetical protein